jgi:hypothetical protein
MKFKISLIAILSILALSVIGCENDEFKVKPKTISLKFENINYDKSNDLSFTNVQAEVNYIEGKTKLDSDELVELNVQFYQNDVTYAYALKDYHQLWESLPYYNQQKNDNLQNPQVYSGYGFDGECFVYGRFYEGDNGETLFVPCGPLQGCIGFPEYCPGPDQAFALKN